MSNLDRFNPGKFVVIDDQKSFVSANIPELKAKATLTYRVRPEQAHRPDLISYAIYGHVHLKWLIIYVNDLFDLDALREGVVIKYVSYAEYVSLLLRTTEAAK